MKLTLVLLAVALACAVANAEAAAPPRADARAWLVENAATGEVLASHDPRRRLPIASITKLMTVLVALRHHELGDLVRVDPRVTSVGQESIYLRAGEEITVRDLVKAALIQSANDAADALALSVAPDYPAFASLMNAESRRLGLADSHFVRPDGLDAPGEMSSARDVNQLAMAAMRIPIVRRSVAERETTIAGRRTLHTWNDLLGVVPGVIGVKTGHTSEAGWSQVAAVRGPGVTIYAAILGSPSRSQRDRDLQTLLAYGLSSYRVVDAISATRAYANVRLPYGKPSLALVAAKPVRAVVRMGRPLVERVVAPSAVGVPVARGQVLGRVEVWEGGRLVGRSALVAARAVGRPGLGGRLGWYASRTLHDALGLLS